MWLSSHRRASARSPAVEPVEPRTLFTALVADYLELHVTRSTGPLAELIDPGTYTADDLDELDLGGLQVPGLDDFLEAGVQSFNGFDSLPSRANILVGIAEAERLLPGVDINLTRATARQAAATFSIRNDSISAAGSFGVQINDARKVSVQADLTSPTSGSLRGYLYYAGPVDLVYAVRPGDGVAGFYDDVFRVNGTPENDLISLTVRDGRLRVWINNSLTTVDLSRVGALAVSGGNGDDLIDLGGGVPAASVYGKSGNDKLYGGAGNDLVDAGPGRDSVWGRGGDDRLLGYANPDRLYGGDGNDTLDGGSGNDQLYGDAGQDRLVGGIGDDYLAGGANPDRLVDLSGADTLYGGGGNDRFWALDGASDYVLGGPGRDTLVSADLGPNPLWELTSSVETHPVIT